MKTLALLVCAVFAAGAILADPAPAVAAGKTHEVTATVVSVDAEAKKLTIKDDKGETKTAPVMDQAADKLKTLKVGDRVSLTCSDGEQGEHKGISAINVVAKTS